MKKKKSPPPPSRLWLFHTVNHQVLIKCLYHHKYMLLLSRLSHNIVLSFISILKIDFFIYCLYPFGTCTTLPLLYLSLNNHIADVVVIFFKPIIYIYSKRYAGGQHVGCCCWLFILICIYIYMSTSTSISISIYIYIYILFTISMFNSNCTTTHWKSLSRTYCRYSSSSNLQGTCKKTNNNIFPQIFL